jgi:uncharacterized membrane protein
MRYKNLDQLIVVDIVMINLIWTFFPYHTPVVGVLLALPLVFGLPGYTLMQVLMHKRSLEPSHILIFTLGLSLAIDVLSGFVLNLLPIGLQASSWVVFLGLLTAVFSLLTMYLRHSRQSANISLMDLRCTIRECMLFGSAIIIIVLAILYSARGVVQQPHADFTDFWLLPSNQPSTGCAVRLGMRSFEAISIRYSVALTINGTKVKTVSFISLAPGQQWEQLVPITLKAMNDVHINARLYRLDKPRSVYRWVSLTLSVHNLKKNKDGNVSRCNAS